MWIHPDGQPHPTAAARAFGHKEINHPELVTNWIEKLKQLDTKIEQYGTMVRDVWTMSEPAAIAAHNEHMELRMAALELLYHPDGNHPTDRTPRLDLASAIALTLGTQSNILK